MTYAECGKILAAAFPTPAKQTSRLYPLGVFPHFEDSAGVVVRMVVGRANGVPVPQLRKNGDRQGAKEVTARRLQGPKTGARSDEMEIDFIEDVSVTPSVARAVSIRFTSNLSVGAYSPEGEAWRRDTRAALFKKYGVPTLTENDDYFFWGTFRINQNPADRPQDATGWRMIKALTGGGGLTLELVEGDTFQKLTTALQDYIDAGTGKARPTRPPTPKL